MANTNLSTYKTLSIDDVSTRTSASLSSDETTNTNTILSNFFTYFKAKHS